MKTWGPVTEKKKKNTCGPQSVHVVHSQYMGNNFRVVDSKMFLELVTGRNPVGEFGDGVDIVQRVRKMTDSHKESVVKVLDPRLTSIPLHEVTDVFYVAMLCVEEQAVERPTMREVILESFCS
ncbi:hypothetical protein Bca101_047168 [Brassica carinata]